MIREANTNDILNLNEIIDLNIFKEFTLDDFNNEFKKIYLLEENNIILAYIYLTILDEIEITDFFVNKEYRKKGCGSKLLTFIINKYNKKIFLEVRTSNEFAIKLYSKHNFKIINTREKYYGNEDAYIMVREI